MSVTCVWPMDERERKKKGTWSDEERALRWLGEKREREAKGMMIAHRSPR